MSLAAVWVRRWQAKLCLLLGCHEAAGQIFRGILARAPEDHLALNSLGYAAVQGGQHALALSYFERLVQAYPLDANAHFNRAYVCEAMGRLDEAALAFHAAIERETNMDRAWYGLGLVRVQQGSLVPALQAFKRNTELQPMSPYGWYQMARVHMDLQQKAQALAVLQHLKGFEPKVAAQLAREIGAVKDTDKL